MISEKAKVLIRKYGESVVNGRTPTYEEMCNENTRKWELIFHISTLESQLSEARARLAGYEEWIPVSEPPKVEGEYLVIDAFRPIYPALYRRNEWSPTFFNGIITHWKPKPEDPKEEE